MPSVTSFCWVRFGFGGALALACSIGCAKPKVATGSGAEVNPVLGAPVEPEYQREYRALERAVQNDPNGPDVAVAADALLALDPPAELAARAHLAAAAQAYGIGRDARAWEQAELGLARLPQGESGELQLALARVRLEATARSGDPAAALEQLSALAGQVSAETRVGLTVRIHERQGNLAQAVAALIEWRSLVPNDHPAAVYAEQRLSEWVVALPLDERQALARRTEEPARSCLRVSMGLAASQGAPSWVEHCRPEPPVVGVLLPRTGRYAALADTQLAAVSAGLEVLTTTRMRPVQVLWEDAGDTPTSALAGAQALVERGAQVIVGPVGQAEVEAVGRKVGASTRVIVPGEGGPGVFGVAPTLEQRIEGLVIKVQALGRRRVIVFAPANAYGNRAVTAAQSAARRRNLDVVDVRRYPPDMTSFSAELEPIAAAMARGAALLLPDRVGRVELVLRQLRRMGVDPSPGGTGVIVTTGEGAREDAFGTGHDALEGIWVAPVAASDAESSAFDRAYVRREGTTPGDQALLVWQALRAAAGDPDLRPPAAQVLQVQQGQLVFPSSTPTPTQNRN